MIVYIDFPQVICYATYSIVVFLTVPLMGILLLNNDKWASFCCNPIIHIFSQRLMFGSVPLIQSVCCLLSTYILSDNTMFISQTITFFLHIGQNIFDHF